MSYLPRDFIETAEGLFFAVVAAGLENLRVRSFLRYARTENGVAKLSSDAANSLLENHFPEYRYHSPQLDALLHGVPVERVVRHHAPRERLAKILARESTDPMEKKLVRLLQRLAPNALAMTQMGVTGSMLIGQHRADSDMDLVIYDRALFFYLRQHICELTATGEMQELDAQAWQEAFQRRGGDLDYHQYLRHERRKHNKALWEGSKFDLALVAQDDLLETPLPGRKIGWMTLKARVTDARHSFDQPIYYRLDHPQIAHLYSHTHTYAGQALDGEWIEARGQVEVTECGEKRLVVGSSREAAGEYIRVIWEER
jgi:predicted nucleotidyltransferase